jgi:hypothetical protein
MRRLSVLIRHLPATSATLTALNGGDVAWVRQDYLLAHLHNALTGSPHPWLPKPGAPTGSRYESTRARLERQRARQP